MKKPRRIAIFIISLAILVLLGYFINIFMNSPATGNIEQASSAEPVATAIFDMTATPQSGPYGSFTVPAALTRQAVEDLTAPTLQNHLFSYQDSTSWRLAVTVTDVSLSAKGYSSSYQLRLDHPEQYQLTKQTVGNNTFNVMTDTTLTGFNKVAFMTKNGKEVQISLYGNGTNSAENLAKTYQQVLQSWQWR